jgi:hypothetical protein
MSAAFYQEARKAIRVLERVLAIQEIPVPQVAKLLKKTPQWVRANLPVIYHSRKSHSVRLSDIEAYQARRIVWPKRERTVA